MPYQRKVLASQPDLRGDICLNIRDKDRADLSSLPIFSLAFILPNTTNIPSGPHNILPHTLDSRKKKNSTMTLPYRPSKPLTILTLNGGGLQAISTLMILDKVLKKIAQEKGIPEDRKPRPCDMFDTIGGIGAGGWLAILLGRFRMDVTACLAEWYNLLSCIMPTSTNEKFRLRLLQHCSYNTDHLMKEVDHLTQAYGTGNLLFQPDTEGARTRHVFVAALASDAKTYHLFRSYKIPKSAKLPVWLPEGPEIPDSFTISHAFGVTGAARYFTKPWEEQMECSGKTGFSDTKFPKPHDITGLALDEMWGIYGGDVPLSAVVNIGPGLPSHIDVQQIARRFSWKLNPITAHEMTSSKRTMRPDVQRPLSDSMKQDVNRPTDHSHDTADQNPTIESVPEGECSHSVAQTNISESVGASGTDAKLRRLEEDMDNNIKSRLNSVHPGSAELYYRLAPTQAPQGTPQNDSRAPGKAIHATLGYLNEPRVDATIDKLVKQITASFSNC